MTSQRKPAAFKLTPDKGHDQAGDPAAKRTKSAEPRTPRAIDLREAVVDTVETDIFDTENDDEAATVSAPPKSRRLRLGGILLAALGLLLSMAVGIWTDRLIRDLFERADWLGWTALAAAAIALIALVVIVIRELWALARLASVDRLRKRAEDALSRGDTRSARSVVDDIARFVAARPQTAAGRRNLEDLRDDVIDGPDLIRLAEGELLTPLDKAAQQMILDAGKRVSVVTAVSPRALVDLAYVVFEAARLIRRISELYGARPGTIGFFRLARSVLAHLAVTGSIAAGDSLVQQVLGHGLAARLSAKLGEGVINGMMTVRIGIAAMETSRPLPFLAVRRPRMGDFVSALARFAKADDAAEPTKGGSA
ncbi:YcjF family protein [Mesorhizobium xinjiangense]|uniref:YcjF family protein n=1 Tax=Mesorhizobium xinjiangense TaxID=2678685 RepID=UPI0012ED0E19|nr:TIGR01620 family protein [Mesorhizobium xinjiangense]